ncbi:hypothetical protein KCU83_g8603, partial [Aureobasidium melanogenum]
MSVNMDSTNVDPAIMEPANETKIPPPDRAKLAEHAQLGEMWAANQNAELNLLGAMNACQSHFDDTTFWERDNRSGYHNYQINDPHACYVARQNSINNITANNKMYADMDDFYAEQQKAYDKLHAYNSTKYSRETIQGADRQKAARRGTDTRRANKAKRHEEMVVGIVEELVALRDYSGVLDEQYKKRFDRVVKEVVAAAKVKMTPEITAKLFYGVAPISNINIPKQIFREHNARDLSETYERTFHYDDGVISKPIPMSVSRLPSLIELTLTISDQYFRGSAPNIMEELNLQQEFLAEKKSIATVWRCTARGEYYPLDIEDDRYPMAEKRMVYRFAVAAAITYNRRDYINMDPKDHYQEFWRAMNYMAQHNRMINER